LLAEPRLDWLRQQPLPLGATEHHEQEQEQVWVMLSFHDEADP
jgi:hypothetical protein